MKWLILPSPEELLDSVDVLYVPASGENAGPIFAETVARLVPKAALPPFEKLQPSKHNGHIFYGEWKQRPLKIIFWWENEAPTEASLYSLAKRLAIRAKQENGGKSGIVAYHLGNTGWVTSLFAGWTAGHYDLGLYKKHDSYNVNSGQEIYTALHSDVDGQAVSDGITIGLVQQEVMQLVNTPASHKSPATLSAWASRSAAQYGYEANTLDKQQLTTLGLNAFLAVNRGSENPAQLIVTRYTHPEATRKVLLVGKGVIFDTGGLSIKDSKNMHYMKSDMAGAATVLGTVEACSRLKLKVDVVAVTPITDNSVDAMSTKPGDVVTSFSGKTIEIIDTDAEGRLVLADALTWGIREYQPDVVIDLATLTGSIIAAIGPLAAGLFSKNDKLVAMLESSGASTGERVWRMPMYDEYHDDMQSDIADIKNLSEKNYAGSITAAKFLEYFTDNHPTWAHLDIAGMAFQPNCIGKGHSATAYGVRLLLHYLSTAG